MKYASVAENIPMKYASVAYFMGMLYNCANK